MFSPASPSAQQNQSKQINDANTYRDKTLLNASAQASAITTEAATASTNYVKAIQADAKAFTDLLPAFEMDRNLFAQQKLAETMALVLTNVQDKFFLPQRADGQPRELRLQLNREPPEPKTGSGESVKRKWTRCKNEGCGKWRLFISLQYCLSIGIFFLQVGLSRDIWCYWNRNFCFL